MMHINLWKHIKFKWTFAACVFLLSLEALCVCVCIPCTEQQLNYKELICRKCHSPLKHKSQHSGKHRGALRLKFSTRQTLVEYHCKHGFLSFSPHGFTLTRAKPQVYRHTLITASVMAYGRHIFLCVCAAVLPHKMNRDRVTFSFLMRFVKCTFSTKLNHSANKLSVVANIVLCAQCTSPRPLSLWPCTWTLTVCSFLQANQADVCDSLSP